MPKFLLVYSDVIYVVATISILTSLANMYPVCPDNSEPMRTRAPGTFLDSFGNYKLKTNRGINEKRVYLREEESYE